jgi:hypothetical protein
MRWKCKLDNDTVHEIEQQLRWINAAVEVFLAQLGLFASGDIFNARVGRND